MIYQYMSLPRHDIMDIVKRGHAAAVLPIGSIEQHGPHLPVGTDSYIVNMYTEKTLAKISDKADFLVLPTLYYALSVEHTNYEGTLALSPETLLHVMTDIAAGLKKTGIDKLFIFNGHGGNDHIIQVAAREILKLGIRVYANLAIGILDALRIDPAAVHADKVETSIMLSLHPETVRRERITPELDTSRSRWMTLSDMNSHLCETWFAEDVAVDGVIGEPTLATEAFGEEMAEKMTDAMAKGMAYVFDRQ